MNQRICSQSKAFLALVTLKNIIIYYKHNQKSYQYNVTIHNDTDIYGEFFLYQRLKAIRIKHYKDQGDSRPSVFWTTAPAGDFAVVGVPS